VCPSCPYSLALSFESDAEAGEEAGEDESLFYEEKRMYLTMNLGCHSIHYTLFLLLTLSASSCFFSCILIAFFMVMIGVTNRGSKNNADDAVIIIMISISSRETLFKVDCSPFLLHGSSLYTRFVGNKGLNGWPFFSPLFLSKFHFIPPLSHSNSG